VKLPVIGRVKLSEKLRFDGKIVGAVVSRKSDKWFISINVDIENPTKERVSDNIVGVDLGVKTFATLSNEEKFDAPKPLKKNLKKIKRQNRSVSRKVLGSKNRKKAIVKLSRTYYKTANIRKDFLDKLSTKLCRENQTIVIEDLNVTGMLKNHCLARAIADLGWSEFRRQLEYKSKIYGCKIVVADRFFPSSKLCPCCGHIKENLTLADRVFKCDCCGFEMDRDIKAAKLLAVLGTASPEITPEDMRALIYSSVIGINETVVSKSGI
jgi:putative transposase